MKKQLLILILMLLPVVAKAYDAYINGIYYDFSGSVATVTYDSDNRYSGNVVIPTSVTYNSKTYSVTSIGDHAFSNCNNLTSIIIPNSVTNIGNSAFYYCSSLTSITISNHVTSIKQHAFSGCTSLTSIIIPKSVKSIDSGAFRGCSNLTSVHITNLAAW